MFLVTRVRTGLDVLLDDPGHVGDRRWAMLANQASVTAAMESARTALQRILPGSLVRLFAPEHGLDGVEQDMETVADRIDPVTGVPVRSLYGVDAATLMPTDEDLDGVEVVLVDLPDIGCRYYTFAATMDAMMAACERSKIELVVLDRPNPMGGLAREGPPVEPGFESFVSRLPTPIRHGLTLGELALLMQRGRYPDLELSVLMCQGWQRKSWWDDTGLPWIPPSPNMPTLDTVAIYPGLCLAEATTLSEGRGTTRPFHLVGAPWIDGQELVRRLRARSLPGVGFRPSKFRPMFGKHNGEVCKGVEIHVTDRHELRPVALGVEVLKAIHDLDPGAFAWRSEPYEFVSHIPAIDLLTGSPAARTAIDSNEPLEPLFESWRPYVSAFEESLEGIILYHDRG